MALAPVTGMLRKRIVRDLSGSLVIGTILANVYWFQFSRPKLAAFKEYRERRAIEDVAQ